MEKEKTIATFSFLAAASSPDLLTKSFFNPPRPALAAVHLNAERSIPGRNHATSVIIAPAQSHREGKRNHAQTATICDVSEA